MVDHIFQKNAERGVRHRSKAHTLTLPGQRYIYEDFPGGAIGAIGANFSL